MKLGFGRLGSSICAEAKQYKQRLANNMHKGYGGNNLSVLHLIIKKYSYV